MRKFSIFFAIMVLAAMLLISCGAEETSTADPNTTGSPEVPPVTADTTATDDGVIATETVVPADATTTPGVPVTGEESAASLSNQLDFDVWNQAGEQIGEVDDMVLDLDNTRISYVIVGTGGFLDIGEKDVLVPWNSLVLQDGTVDVPGVDANAFIIQMDQETFNNFPDVDLASILPAIGEPAGDWDVDIRTYWESGVVPTTPTADPNMTATPIPDVVEPTATADTDSGVGEPVALQGVVLASDVLGTSVALSPGQGDGTGQGTDQATATADPNQVSGPGVGNFSGTIEDMIIDTDSGDILYILVNTTLDDGERWIPVPPSSFQWDADNATALLNVNPAVLRDAPFFMDGEFPDTTVDGWNSEWDTFWQNN